MNTNTKATDLTSFLQKHSAKASGNNKDVSPTHTRIGDKDLNIYGGSYVISNDDHKQFLALYYDFIFNKKRMEYLTEKQLEHVGPLLVDFDFRYQRSVSERRHTSEDIQNMVILYLEELKEFFVFDPEVKFDVFIFEKPSVNMVSDKSYTKDGIHMIVGLQMDHIMQIMLRSRILEKIQVTWENLKVENSWDSVLDEGISKGTTNWQLYGSRKPGNEAYELTHHYNIVYDNNDGEFCMNEKSPSEFNLSEDFIKLSARNENNPKLSFNPKIISLYNSKLELKKSGGKKKSNIKVNKIVLPNQPNVDEPCEYISVDEIVNEEMLKKAVDILLNSLSHSEMDIKEIHDYTQILPEKYYEAGSHLLNRQVAFALKNTDERLFLSWIMLRSKASDFDYAEIPKLYVDWNKYFNKNEDNEGVTKKSIIYWAKQDAYEEYEKVKYSTVDAFIEQMAFSQTDFDFAVILHYLFKDKYVCTSLTNRTWYIFKNHRWDIDRGMTLRLAISKEMFSMFRKKVSDIMIKMSKVPEDSQEYVLYQKQIKTFSTVVSVKLKQTSDKNNIMREAMELFYDKDFIKKVDSNKNLLCFNNGVIDFTTKTFRDGYPQDYITKSTGINYIPHNIINPHPICSEISSFMEKLFPDETLNTYMWSHLASCLIGTNKNQTFNIYRGSGSNGKSILTDLMTQCLGDYKGTVPITLVTEKRNSIGGTSSEVIQLKGIRYAVMQEPSKDSRINEGVMKELTGGDPVQGRALYCESEVFEPQFKLVVCTNSLFEINSNDDGTWRRIRICDFKSKFIDADETHTDDTKHVFLKDKSLKERLPAIAPFFMSMLVDLAFKTEGTVQDCDIVLEASNKYRQGQDHLSAFVLEKVLHTKINSDKIKKNELSHEFKKWFEQEHGQRKQPRGCELNDYMDKRFGKSKISGWVGVKIIYPEESSDEMDNL